MSDDVLKQGLQIPLQGALLSPLQSPFIVESPNGDVFDPGNLEGLQVYVDTVRSSFTLNGSLIDTATSIGNATINMVQAADTSRPTLNPALFGGQGGIQFVRAGDRMTNASNLGTQNERTLIAVLQLSSAIPASSVMGWGTSTSSRIITANNSSPTRYFVNAEGGAENIDNAVSSPFIYALRYRSNTACDIFHNSIEPELTFDPNNVYNNNLFYIGSRSNDANTALSFQQILIGNRALTNEEMTKTIQYMALQNNIPLT